ncbi:uncharacterized protein LOC130667842 [Microplitis mediator]|uniref:uncharacterized protein LOC130667842 n=1 Tax=Microplitis mediator TaxID=375433 RepID=UPI0025577A28|nr:uncharacterized protein LOC130667842 [Microplitis mediator]XP_057325691.1 uncharacterized protein LOC130667842 [Microplitis mediator]XP_057325692.1 uncharacterized protein LOC130667842 [Microplitis mediator]
MINRIEKKIAQSKKIIEDPKSTPEEISKAQDCLQSDYKSEAFLIEMMYHLVKNLEECPHCSYFIPSSDYGREFLLLKEEHSDLFDKIMAISSEDISLMIKNPLVHTMENNPPECNCAEVCFRKWENPIAAMRRSCTSFSFHLREINNTKKCIAESKKKIDDPKSTPEEISKEQDRLRLLYIFQALAIVTTHYAVKTFEECPYSSYFIQTTNFGREFLFVKERDSDLINEIMAISSEDISSMMENPSVHNGL